MQAVLASGQLVTLRQETQYPLSGAIHLVVTPAQPVEFTLRLRIPYWSHNTTIQCSSAPQAPVQPGRYVEIRRLWQPGDSVDIQLDFTPHFWSGERECQDLVSIYRGPILLAYDQRYNRQRGAQVRAALIPEDPLKISRDLLPAPLIDADQLDPQPLAWEDWHSPMLLLQARTAQGEPLYLCDFASAGATGTLYRSWLPITRALPSLPFTRANPLRSAALFSQQS